MCRSVKPRTFHLARRSESKRSTSPSSIIWRSASAMVRNRMRNHRENRVIS